MSLTAIESHRRPEPREQLATLFKAAGDTLRLDILRVLSDKSFDVRELCEIFGMRQSGMSHHLKVLANAGLVTTRREGNSVFYRRQLPARDAVIGRPQQSVFDAVDSQTLEETLQERMAAVEARRAERSRAFFARHVARLDERQELIASHEQYGELACSLLDQALPDGGEAALEAGPGEGRFLPALSRRFRQVTGLDNSPAMLDRARQAAAAGQLDNVRLVTGDWPEQVPGTGFDAIVLNMVLHHLPAPADSFGRAASLLRPGGVLLITELCRHDQAWAQESCGDLWLGFDSEDLHAWAQRAGLEALAAQFQGQRNGFQVQVRSYRLRT
jgi:DNA-binding transcriptional ArsR family regulator